MGHTHIPPRWRGPTLGLLGLCILGCGSPPPPAASLPSSQRVLTETEANIIILETIMGSGFDTEREWSVDIASKQPLDVQLRLRDTAYGIAWIGPQELADHEDALPEPHTSNRLVILPGHGDDAEARILVLDHRNYRFEEDSDRVRGGAVGRGEAEGRLRRDVRDFLAHVRQQGVTPP